MNLTSTTSKNQKGNQSDKMTASPHKSTSTSSSSNSVFRRKPSISGSGGSRPKSPSMTSTHKNSNKMSNSIGSNKRISSNHFPDSPPILSPAVTFPKIKTEVKINNSYEIKLAKTWMEEFAEEMEAAVLDDPVTSYLSRKPSSSTTTSSNKKQESNNKHNSYGGSSSSSSGSSSSSSSTVSTSKNYNSLTYSKKNSISDKLGGSASSSNKNNSNKYSRGNKVTNIAQKNSSSSSAYPYASCGISESFLASLSAPGEIPTPAIPVPVLNHKDKYKHQLTYSRPNSASSTSSTDSSRRMKSSPKRSAGSTGSNKINKSASKNHLENYKHLDLLPSIPITKLRSPNKYKYHKEEEEQQRRRSPNHQPRGHDLKLLNKNIKKLDLTPSTSNNENHEVFLNSMNGWLAEEEEGDIGGPQTSRVNMPSTTTGRKKCQNRKFILNKKEQCITTEIPYHVYDESCIEEELRLSNLLKGNDEKDVEEVVEVPTWREVYYSPTRPFSSADEEEPTDEATYLKRHARHEQDEKKRKRWDAQKQREENYVKRLKERYAERESHKLKKKRRANRKLGVFDDWSDEETLGLNPKPESIEFIRSENDIPIQVFGYPLPIIQKEEFSLPWTPTDRKPSASPKVQDQEDEELSIEDALLALLATPTKSGKYDEEEDERSEKENEAAEDADGESSEDEVQIVQGKKTPSPPPPIPSTSASVSASTSTLAATSIKTQSNPKPIEESKNEPTKSVPNRSTIPRALLRIRSSSFNDDDLTEVLEASRKNSTPETRELRGGRGGRPIYTVNNYLSPILPPQKEETEKFMKVKGDESDSSSVDSRNSLISTGFQDVSDAGTEADEEPEDSDSDEEDSSSSSSSSSSTASDLEEPQPKRGKIICNGRRSPSISSSKRKKIKSPKKERRRINWSKRNGDTERNLRPKSPISISSVELKLVNPDGSEEELNQINSNKIGNRRNSRNSSSRLSPNRSSASPSLLNSLDMRRPVRRSSGSSSPNKQLLNRRS